LTLAKISNIIKLSIKATFKTLANIVFSLVIKAMSVL